MGKVAVINWDVHHGNGTRHIYYQRGDVMIISLHQDGCFPADYGGEMNTGCGEGAGANINIPLMAGASNEAWLYAMDRIVLPALSRLQPDLIIVACGYDASAIDPLGRMLLHSESYRSMTRKVRQAVRSLCSGRLVMVDEGGYSEAYVPFCGLAAMEQLSGIKTDIADPLLAFIEQQQPRDTFNRVQYTLIVPQIQMDPAITIDATRFQPELFNLSCQSQVCLMAL